MQTRREQLGYAMMLLPPLESFIPPDHRLRKLDCVLDGKQGYSTDPVVRQAHHKGVRATGPAPVNAEPHIAIRTDAFTVAEIEALVVDPANGAICSFSGVVRNQSHGRDVTALEYDAYVPMAEKLMRQIAADIGREFPINRLAMVHRIGRMSIGELAVVVSVGAPHREAAFAAARAGIDRLKKSVPIWKKEYFTDGSAWVGATPGE